MEKSFVYFDRILNKLAQSYPKDFTLEELATLLIPTYTILKTFTQNIAAQRENQAKLLDALILLDDQGYIVLNPLTEKSSITIKGLIKINSRILCN
ncbi:hypothetical protein [Flavobacterium bizetiae]|uniref:hypothetical protein n=1 Tax=Flavobacterium bizetiae TaxID=2704140 RepID=UPI0037569661